jgi:hypothetical protein
MCISLFSVRGEMMQWRHWCGQKEVVVVDGLWWALILSPFLLYPWRLQWGGCPFWGLNSNYYLMLITHNRIKEQRKRLHANLRAISSVKR